MKIIVIGASAGGFEILASLFKNISSNVNATFIVVVHLAHNTSGQGLVNYVKKNSNFSVKLAENGEAIEKGTIYIAPPDFHILLKENSILLTNGPLENKYRPSIDQLFRSAAVHFKSRVIGVVLSGLLDDGTSGMISIKKTGGTLVIQDPAEAAFPDMPLSVKGNTQVDHISSVEQMPALLEKLILEPKKEDKAVPEDLLKEVKIAERVLFKIEDTEQIGELTPFICPDCGGSLWQHYDTTFLRFRCHTGHSYSAITLLEQKSKESEESLWVAIRVLEEKRNLLLLMAEKDKHNSGQNWGGYERRAKETKVHIDRLRDLIMDSDHFIDQDLTG